MSDFTSDSFRSRPTETALEHLQLGEEPAAALLRKRGESGTERTEPLFTHAGSRRPGAVPARPDGKQTKPVRLRSQLSAWRYVWSPRRERGSQAQQVPKGIQERTESLLSSKEKTRD